MNKSAKEMFEKTGVDGIMIGRGSFGNPWIFREIKYYLETNVSQLLFSKLIST